MLSEKSVQYGMRIQGATMTFLIPVPFTRSVRLKMRKLAEVVGLFVLVVVMSSYFLSSLILALLLSVGLFTLRHRGYTWAQILTLRF